MKIEVQTQILQKKLSLLNHAISTKSQLPILLNILLEVKDKTLTLSSTDLEIGITTSIDGVVEKEGSVTAPAKTFFELVNSFTSDTTVLEVSNNTLTVTTKNSTSSFQTLPVEEFPKLYQEKGDRIATFNTDSIQKEFESVLFASSTDTTRPALSGVLVKAEEKGVLLVATDGYRLSLKHSTTTVEDKTLSLIVPSRVFREVTSLKEEGDSISVYIAKDHNQIIFEQGDTLLVGRLIDAQFPPFEKIIPTDHSTVTSFDREELLKAVKMCSIFARESANIIKFSLTKKSIVVSSQTPSLGENTVTVDAKLTGEENEIAFNARYLLDVLSHLSYDDLTFEMTGPLNPGVFKIQGDSSYLHLIMPIRIQG